MMNCRSFALFLVYLTFITCLVDNVSGNQPVCAGMFTTGILKADSSTLSSPSHSTDLEPYKAIVNTSRAWCADTSDIYQYLQVNFGRLRNISGIGIQGYKPGFVTYITKFTVTYTTDDVNWNYYKDISNNIKLFINSPNDDNDVIVHPLSTLSAFRIRIKPQEWQNWICMRMELFTCDPVDGAYSDWSSWTECNNSIQSRSRLCDSPFPARGGLDCSGNRSVIRSCIQNVTGFSDPCISDPCMNGSQCIWSDLSSNNYTCNCSDGFTGHNCTMFQTLVFPDPCISDPCMNGSQCIWSDLSSNNYTCNCSDGFTGHNCTVFQNLVFPDPCISDPCMNGSQCIWSDLSSNNYTCNCSDGFTGHNCTVFQNLDPCVPNPCQNATACISFMNMSSIEYTCNCTEGITGKNCTLYEQLEQWEFIPSQEMHAYYNVVVPVAVSVASSAVISGSFGIIYFIAKSKLSKIAPARNIIV